ncbi:heterocyst frequency control protein PatD [Leptothoe sp. PORK10 BA2]|uniref:heterocyst frequency control protein PatD n=1 Tax=Leptothoe sp. PORK10 BA2 TaxID=3110254 RepID=UPI002B21C295|nr:heterocyst frequency control protein PatD [Leptothoe sp. PORK10 BA2]MEA5463074.1 heterocyst frequency control protein PatD [Leptothoe sp. PORK10 BA2]
MTFTHAHQTLVHYAERLTQLQRVMGQETMAQQAHSLQTFFRQELWPLVTQLDLPQQRSQWLSAITEMQRHMRLLAVEISFVQAARQGQTRQQRLGQIEHRLGQLQGFTQVMMSLLANNVQT